MEDQQGPIIVAVVVALVAALGVAAWFSGSGTSQQGGVDNSKRFVAKPGTRRENATALSSTKRDLAGDGFGSAMSGPGGGDSDYTGEGVADGERIQVRSLSPPENEKELSEEAREIRSALNSLDPERGLARLDALLVNAESREVAAQIHMAMGLLHAQKTPPDNAASDQAFQAALDEASNRELRQTIVQHHAGLLLARGDNDRAQAKIAAVLEESGEPSIVEGRLRVMLGQIHEASGDTAAAETEYRNALQQISTLPAVDPAAQSDVLRLAGLQLSRLYHTTGRDEEARDLVHQLEMTLSTGNAVEGDTDALIPVPQPVE